MKVLELGCGTGLVSIAAKLGGAKMVLATDLTKLCRMARLDSSRSAKLPGIWSVPRSRLSSTG